MKPEGIGDLHSKQGMGKMVLGMKTAHEIVQHRQGKEARVENCKSSTL